MSTINPTTTDATGAANPRTSETLTVDQLYEKSMALASNLWWSWNPEVSQLFRDLDPVRWRQLDHNPVALLREFTPERLYDRATEPLGMWDVSNAEYMGSMFYSANNFNQNLSCWNVLNFSADSDFAEIGRASCRERLGHV